MSETRNAKRDPVDELRVAGESIEIPVGKIHCFFGCGFTCANPNPFEGHAHMEDHYDLAHRKDLDRLRDRGYIG